MGIQTITTPTGEELVVIPRAEYEAMLADAFEDGADAATYTASLVGLAPEEVLPAEVSAAILRSEGRVRAFREWRGYSLDTLAELSHLPRAMLVEIEAGQRILDRESAARLGIALELPPGWLQS
ncbi:MAG: transcriptional regulator, family [Devosia sp.]|nr:transcriptional regulator, family [Devosia sp.]